MTPEKKPVGRPPERLTIVINFQQGLSQPPHIETVTWPKTWPMPVYGDRLISSTGLAGRVQRYIFDPSNNKLGIEVAP